MICKMFTINGKAPTIGNTALTGSAIADPGIVLEYYNTGVNTAHYAGITLRGPSSNTADIDYSNMCYYSNTKYDNPNPADLTKAHFYPISSLLKVNDPSYPTKQCFTATYGYVADQPLIFPLDEEYNHVGAYLIPRSAYSTSSLYVYLWLPSVTGAPEGNDTVGVDFTTLEPQGANIGLNIIKCDMPAYNNVAFMRLRSRRRRSALCRTRRPCSRPPGITIWAWAWSRTSPRRCACTPRRPRPATSRP